MVRNRVYAALKGYYPLSFIKKSLKCGFTCVLCALLACWPVIAETTPWDGLSEKEGVKKYFLPTGFVFPVVTSGAIYSYLIESPCICIVEVPVEYLGKEMIPKGTMLIGSAKLYPNTTRVIISFQVMVFPNGQEMSFQGVSLQDDPEGKYYLALGIPGKEGKTKSKLPAQVLLGTLGTAANAVAPATGNIAAQGVSTAAQSLIGNAQQKLSYQPDYTVTVPKGICVQVFNLMRIEY
jgi:hypothetical protein